MFQSERVDDIPLLFQQMKVINLASFIDASFNTHGNWTGLSIGNLATIALAYILSTRDHRLCAVLPWAKKRRYTIQTSLGLTFLDRDLTDDRLAILLRYFSSDLPWFALEALLTDQAIAVFELDGQPFRIDSTTAMGYWEIVLSGLFQRGHSKNKRPDLPQIRIKMCSLDPLGFPAYTQIYSGQCNDDPLYIPAVTEIKKGLGKDGLFFVGDCKMASFAARAFIAKGKDFYFCPIAGRQLPKKEKEELIYAAISGQTTIRPIYRAVEGEEEPELIGYGYECKTTQRGELDDSPIEWEERRFPVLSLALMQDRYRTLVENKSKAEEELNALVIRKSGKRAIRELEELVEKSNSVLKARGMEGIIKVTCGEEVTIRTKRKWRNRPERKVVEKSLWQRYEVDEEALFEKALEGGWRIYGTNMSEERLSLEEGYRMYRKSHRIDGSCFRRMKGDILKLTPTYLSKSEHVKGMVRLLSLGVRVLCWMEFVVRRGLASSGKKLKGLYQGNPKRETSKPTGNLLLSVFKGIELIGMISEKERYEISPLSEVQREIIELLGFPEHIYQDLTDLRNFHSGL